MVVACLMAAACGGDDDVDGAAEQPGTADPGDTADDSPDDGADAEDGGDDGGDGTAGGPVEGALVSVLTFDFGLWALDPDGGDPFEVAVPDVGFADRTDPPLVTPDGSTAVLTVFTTVEGESFSNHVGLAAVDLGTGEGRLVAEFGQDRADDDATDVSSWELLGASDTTAWVAEIRSDVDGEAVLAVDLVSGEVAIAVAASESLVRSPAVVDGALHALVDGSIVRLGPGGWEVVVSLGELEFDEPMSPAMIAEFAITRSGAPLDEEWASTMLSFFDPTPTISGMVGAGGFLYWQFNENWSNTDGTDTAIVGGFIRFDPATARITGAWPVGPSVGEFLEDNQITTSSQGTWHATGDTVWFADGRDDGDLLRLEPAVGVDAFDIEPLAGADYTRIDLVPNDPDGVWLILEDWTITESGESGTSATGETRFVLVDPVTGDFLLEIDESDLIGF